jgi:hypothetical protein
MITTMSKFISEKKNVPSIERILTSDFCPVISQCTFQDSTYKQATAIPLLIIHNTPS